MIYTSIELFSKAFNCGYAISGKDYGKNVSERYFNKKPKR
jgi:hypothetical protein